jgi:hypothetical protein
MQLRQIIAEDERRLFAQALASARASRGVGIRQCAQSRLENSHITFGRLYALYKRESDAAAQMLGGFIMHDLATLPQSFPRPDLTHLPSQSVFEGSELWSLSTGVGRIAGMAAAAVAGLLQAKALLVYPLVKPADLTVRYSRFDFIKAGDPIPNPYGRTSDGQTLWVQPMVLEGEPLARYVRIGFDFIFGAGADERALRFDLPAIPSQTPVPFSAEAHVEQPSAIPLEAPPREEHSNGAAQH